LAASKEPMPINALLIKKFLRFMANTPLLNF
jgi:hypothetical protein